jgi:hypothetical protein
MEGLKKCSAKEDQYNFVEDYIRTVSSAMIKADIAKILANLWDQDVKEIRNFLNVSLEADIEILNEFADVDMGITAYQSMIREKTDRLGWKSIDESFGGIRKKEVVLIGSYSKVGKTDWLTEIIVHSIPQRLNCLIFSLEMDLGAFMERIMSKILKVSIWELRELMQSPERINKIIEIKDTLQRHVIVDDVNDLSMDDIKKRIMLANKYKFDRPVDRVFVDYFQYLKYNTTYEQISQNARNMKPLAKQLNVELFMLTQFNRMGSPWDEPSIKDFKGGNDMESSFDKALLLWREYSKPGIPLLEKEKIKNITKVKLVSRNGLRGREIIEMYYDPITTRIIEKPDEI